MNLDPDRLIVARLARPCTTQLVQRLKNGTLAAYIIDKEVLKYQIGTSKVRLRQSLKMQINSVAEVRLQCTE
jgi:ribosomal protein L18